MTAMAVVLGIVTALWGAGAFWFGVRLGVQRERSRWFDFVALIAAHTSQRTAHVDMSALLRRVEQISERGW